MHCKKRKLEIDASENKYDPTLLHKTGIPVAKIVNVVAKYKLVYIDAYGNIYPVEINIAKLTLFQRTQPYKYNPGNFAAAPIKIFNGALGTKVTTALIFNTGSVIHTGGQTEDELRIDAHELVRQFVCSLKIPIAICNFRITNIVLRMKMDFAVNLIGLQAYMGHRAKYEPSGVNPFPAVRIKGLNNPNDVNNSADNPNAAALIFVSGAVVLAGANSMESAEKNHKMIYELCKKFEIDKTKINPDEYRTIQRRISFKDFCDSVQKSHKIQTAPEGIEKIDYEILFKELMEQNVTDLDEGDEEEEIELTKKLLEECIEENTDEITTS